MEKLTDLFVNLKDRFTSPLIFSFLISWLVVNWQIPVALFWYNGNSQTGVQLELMSYVSNTLDAFGSFLLPLILAIAYTILNPILRNWISAFYTWNTRWGETWNLSISKGSKVVISKYLSLRKDYVERTKILDEIISRESSTQERLNETESALLSSRNEMNKVSEELSNYRRIRDNLYNIDVIRGNWKRVVVGALNEQSENIEINGTNVSIRDGVKFDQKYQINSFTYNVEGRTVRFMLLLIKEANMPFYSFEDLELRHDEMVGHEYKTGSRSEVRYVRY
ncbi:MAG TPA: hypothetical protein VK508_15695 [Cyclobacteriaceae bacterium]|nr:hypothetical protein [Cyclobacteriaceae bacterium]